MPWRAQAFYSLRMNACIVVAGGAALRLGGIDKAALRIGKATLLDNVLAAAGPLCSRLIVVGPVRPTSAPGVVFTIEADPGGGPVPAVLAGLAEAAGAEHVYVLAADLPLLSRTGLQQLLVALEETGAGAAAAPGENDEPNPLLAVYRYEALRSAAEKLGAGSAGLAAARLLPDDTVVVPIDPDESINVNTPADLTLAISTKRKRRG